jgi:hypothetical protein
LTCFLFLFCFVLYSAFIRRRRRINRQRAAKMANVTYMPIYDDANAWDDDERAPPEYSHGDELAGAGGRNLGSSHSQQYEMTAMGGGGLDTMGGYNDPYSDVSPPVTAKEPSTAQVGTLAGTLAGLPPGAGAPVVVAQHHHDTSSGGGGGAA